MINKKLKNKFSTAKKTGLACLLSLSLTASVFGFSGSYNGQVWAQFNTTNTQPVSVNNFSLTAIPPRYGDDGMLKLKPGEKTQIQVRVKNITDKPLYVDTKALDFVIGDDGTTPIEVTESVSNRWSLASWMTVVPQNQRIAPNQTVGVNVLIEVPEDALPGGHYAMILHQPSNSDGSIGDKISVSQSAINQRVGTLTYLIVDGPINEEAYIRNFNVPKFSEYGPVPFSFEVQNNSDVHITPRISMDIENFFTQKVDNIKIDEKNIFPFTTRNYDGKWDRIWGFGYYTATLTMSYGTTGGIVLAKTSFWLLPVKIIIAITFVFLAIILALLAIKRHLKHRRSFEEQKIKALEEKISKLEHQKD